MSAIDAVYEDGVFKPVAPVDLPEGTRVRMERGAGVDYPARSEPPADWESRSMDGVYEVLGLRSRSGEHDVAERHNEHQP